MMKMDEDIDVEGSSIPSVFSGLPSPVSAQKAPRPFSPNYFRLWYAMQPLVIGGRQDHHAPYLKRWYVLPRNNWLNLYVHKFEDSDDDRALHDHPWWFLSLIVKGGYHEHRANKGVRWRSPGTISFSRATGAHRVELPVDVTASYQANFREPNPELWVTVVKPAWTLLMTGPKVRNWGFHCPKGWIPWEKFTNASGTQIESGCGEI